MNYLLFQKNFQRKMHKILLNNINKTKFGNSKYKFSDIIEWLKNFNNIYVNQIFTKILLFLQK